MSKLLQNSTPAERKRGCVFGDHFRSQAEVEANGGAVTGAPTFSPATGVTLDGITDYIAYDLVGTEFDSDPISVVVEFTPDFNWDLNAEAFFISTLPGGSSTVVYKRDNAGANVIRIEWGGTFIAQIPSATYSPFWLQNARNVLVVSGTTGDTDAWLNGNAILVNDVSAWAPGAATTMHMGANTVGASLFDGTIHSLQIYKAKLTAQEAADFYNRTTYSYMENATGVWQMRMQDHDPVTPLTLDSSGQGNDLTLVHVPPKLPARHGYELDSLNDYMTINDMDISSDDISFIIEVQPDFPFDDNAETYIFDATLSTAGGTLRYFFYKRNNAAANTLRLMLGDTEIVEIASATYSSWWQVGKRLTFVISGRTGDSSVWIDGEAVVANDNTAWTPDAPDRFYVCARYDDSRHFGSQVNSFAILPIALTPLQALDATIQLQQKRNQV